MLYNLRDEKISYIGEDDIIFDTYTRPSIYNDNALILNDIENKISFSLINVNNHQNNSIFSLSTVMGSVTPQVSDNYIVWRDEYGGGNVYIYNLKTDDISKIDFKKLDVNIFSMHLGGSVLYINSSTDILFCDLEQMNHGLLTKKSPHRESNLDTSYSISKISLDNQYVSLLEKYPGYHYVSIIKDHK